MKVYSAAKIYTPTTYTLRITYRTTENLQTNTRNYWNAYSAPSGISRELKYPNPVYTFSTTAKLLVLFFVSSGSHHDHFFFKQKFDIAIL